MFRDGPVTAGLAVEHNGVVPGEMVELSGEVVNDSSRDIEGINIIMYETVIFKRKHINKSRRILEIKRGGMEPYSRHSLAGTHLTIPSLPPTMVTNLVNINYWLKLEVELPGFDLEPQILLVVGTEPARNLVDQFGPLCASVPQHWGKARLEKKERKKLYKGDTEFVPRYKMYQHKKENGELQLY